MKITLCILLFVTAFTALNAKSGDPIVLIYADTLSGFKGNAGEVRVFNGNVHLKQGNVDVWCNTAYQYIEDNRAELIGDVMITQQTLTLYSEKVDYFGETATAFAYEGVTIIDKSTKLTANEGKYNLDRKIADFSGDVVIEDDSATIHSDAVRHYRTTEESNAYGQVVIIAKQSNSILSGDTIKHYPDRNYTLAYGNPLFIQIDTVKVTELIEISPDSTQVIEKQITDSTVAIADTLEAYRSQGSEKYVFKNNVKIKKRNVSARAGFAEYKKSEDLISLTLTPIVWHDSTQLHGDTIYVFIPEKKLRTIRSINKALALSRDHADAPQRINQISSGEILIDIFNDDISSITGKGEAKSLYFLGSEKNYDGAAKNAADKIEIRFDEGEPGNIHWTGAIQGEFFPENLIAGQPEKYYLPEFNWDAGKPVSSLFLKRIPKRLIQRK
ncbi:MAG: OstA-like protein [Candidatus Kapaibacterium sp.]